MDFEQRVFQKVSELTGQAVAGLSRGMHLEMDMGMDSIKLMGLLNNLMDLLPAYRVSQLNMTTDFMGRLQTLGDLIDAIEGRSSQKENRPAAASQDPQTKPGDAGQKITQPMALLDAQYMFLVSHQLLKSTSLCATLRLQGPFDLDVAQTCWQELIQRHPSLRTYFHIPADATRFKDFQYLILENPRPPAMAVTDLRRLDNKAQETAVSETFEDFLNYEWRLDQWPLHRFSVLRLADDICQLFFANEHIVSDGLGNQQLLGEFLELYRARLQKDTPQLPQPVSFEAFDRLVAAINAQAAPAEEKALAAYTSSQGRDTYFWNPHGDPVPTSLSRFANKAFYLDRQTTVQLMQCTRQLRFPINSILVAAFLQTVAKYETAAQSIILQLPTSGKIYPHVDASQVIGGFAQNLALSFVSPQPHESPFDFLGRVHREIEQGLVDGLDRAQTRRMAGMVRDNIVLQDGKIPKAMRQMMQAAVKSNLYFPYTGHTGIASQYGSLAVKGYRAGTINSPGALDVLQEIFDERLHIFANFDSRFFSAAFIEQIIADYMQNLKRLASIRREKAEKALPMASVDLPEVENLCRVATEVCQKTITAADAHLDLEAELGIDSLERIRMISKILSLKKGKVDRDALFGCRSVHEMAAVVARDHLAEQISTSRGKSAVVTTPAPNPEPSPPAEMDAGLADIPYLHFMRQAALTPEAIAVTGNESRLTYGELDALSNQVANYLRGEGMGSGSLVGVMTQRGPNMLVAIMGAVKAGAAYVPVDPDYPAGRIQYILNHAQVKILITESALAAKLTESLSADLALEALLYLDDWTPMIPVGDAQGWKQTARRTWAGVSAAAPELKTTPDDLMVVLYTSGSTGNPKGVALHHRGYMNRLAWHQRTFQLKPGERVAQKTSCCFDISVWELFWPLMVGGTVCAVDRELVRNPWRLAQWLQTQRINIMHFVPSMFGEFVRALASEDWQFPDLRWLIFSGEALPVPFVQNWIDQHGLDVGLANLYGPTEASIDVTCHIIEQRPADDDRMPIGQAIDQVHILILDGDRRPVPQGELGELYIGGVQLAVGYLNDPQRTAEAFVPNPFEHIPGEHIYRTGDLSSELADGEFDYHGRIDSQIKIRGFRVELGEIEAALSAHPAIRESGVLAVDFGEQQKLVAWLAGEKVSAQDVKEFVGRRLPDYMIPHHILWLSDLPKNHNGKLDRKALLADFDKDESFDRDVPDGDDAAGASGPETLPLGPAQRWLVSYFDPPYQWWGSTRFLFKQPLALYVFIKACNQMMARHAALRTVFEVHNGQWQQKILTPKEAFEPTLYDGSHLDEAQRDAEIQRMIQATGQTLTLDTLPLWKMIIVRVAESGYDICIVGHHMVGDLVSGNILFAELWQTYHRLLSEDASDASPAAETSYADLVKYLQSLDRQGDCGDHAAYWQSSFPSPDQRFDFPADHVKGANIESAAAREEFTLSAQDSRKLLRNARTYFATDLYALLVAPLYRLMAEWTEQSWVVLSHKVNGRNLGNGHPHFLPAVGNFAVQHPLGIDVDSAEGWRQGLQQVSAAFETVPLKGVSYDWISDQLPDHMYPDHKLTPVRVNYLGNLTVPPSDLFEIKPQEHNQRLAPPDQKRTILIEVYFAVVDGVLQMDISYSQNHYLADTIRRLGTQYLTLVRQMLAEIPAEPISIADSEGHRPPVQPPAAPLPPPAAPQPVYAARPADGQHPPSGWRTLFNKRLIALYIVSFLSGFSMGIFNPLIALFMEQWQVEKIWIGANSTLNYLVIAIGALLVGKLISRFGVRRIMLVGLLMTGLSAPLFPMTADLTGWFVIRAVMGMGVCLYMIGGQTALNIFAHENRRAVTTALHAAAFGIGFGVSPVVGTQVYVLFPKLAFIIGGAVVLSGLLVVGLMLPESRFSAATRFSRRLVARISLPLHGVFAYGAFEGIVVSMFPLFLLHQNFSVEEIGYAVTLFILGTGVGMLPVSFLGDRWGRGRVLLLIAFIGLISILAVTASERRMLIFISSGIIGASVGPIFPLTLAIIGASLKRQEMPSGSALFTAAFSYGCAAGPMVSALMMDHLGDRYVFMMINFLLALLIIRILIRPQFLRRRSAAQRGVEPRRRAARRPGHRPGEMPYPANP